MEGYADNTGDKTTWKIHSHSDTDPTDRAEIESMGYWFYYETDFQNGKLINKNAQWSEAPYYSTDLKNRINTGVPSMVYFPKSGHIYRINPRTLPTLIETRRK